MTWNKHTVYLWIGISFCLAAGYFANSGDPGLAAAAAASAAACWVFPSVS